MLKNKSFWISIRRKVLNNKKEIVVLFGLLILFIFIRSLYYNYLFKFIYDQATSSTFVLELFQNKTFSLIGPPMSLNINDRQIFFGGLSYFIQFFFMFLGKWDPFWSTYLFMLFSSLMIFPLFYGISRFINKRAAYLMVIIYTLTPFYIEGTTQLWNPYFQIALVPLLIFLMGLYKDKKSLTLFLAISIMAGLIFQLHYQFIINLVGLTVYYFFYKKLGLKYFITYLLGIALGVSNLILFEIRNDFYNTRTVFIFIQNLGKASSHQMADYYVMSVVFMGLMPLLFFFKKAINTKTNIVFFIILSIFAMNYTIFSASTRNYPDDWYYKDELKTYEIIRDAYFKEGLRDFNVFQFYSATGESLKYFMKRDGLKINYNDYYNNKYLFVVYKNKSYLNDPAYEVNSFKPHKVINTWQINDYYNLYLLERK
jgi:hypothetical protein